MKKTGFTFIEIVLVMSVLAILLPLVFSTIMRVSRIKEEITVQNELYTQTYELFERFNVLLQDYTIDYEEYFNRQRVGCNGAGGNSFSRNVGDDGYCKNFTAYGNKNSLYFGDADAHLHYYNSSLNQNPVAGGILDYLLTPRVFQGTPNIQGTVQSFGQYSKLFYDVKNDTNDDGNLVGDTDDIDLGSGPIAIANATGVQELYLISKDGDKRLYLRRKLLDQQDIDGDSYSTGDAEKLYVLQMLKLRGFDAGAKHNYNDTSFDRNPGVFDGQIDTWACDASAGFAPISEHQLPSNSLGGAYVDYYLPLDNDDCWITMYQGIMTFTDWNLTLYPVKPPKLARLENDMQINPYVKIFLYARPYLPFWQLNVKEYLAKFHIAIETMFNIQTNYEG